MPAQVAVRAFRRAGLVQRQHGDAVGPLFHEERPEESFIEWMVRRGVRGTVSLPSGVNSWSFTQHRRGNTVSEPNCSERTSLELPDAEGLETLTNLPQGFSSHLARGGRGYTPGKAEFAEAQLS